MKKTFVFTAILSCLAAILRILQLIFVIDYNGHFAVLTGGDVALCYSVYIVMIAAVIIGLVDYIKYRKVSAEVLSADGKFFAVFSLALAVFAMILAGLGIGDMLTTKKIDPLCILAFLSALYFAVLAFELFKDKKSVFSDIFGIFPPVYVVVKGIFLFFESFKSINKSSMKIEMLTICAVALFMVSLVLLRQGATLSFGRFRFSASVFCVFAAAYAADELYEIFTVFGDKKPYLPQFVFIMFTLSLVFIALYFLNKKAEIKQQQPAIQEQGESALDDDTKQKLDVLLQDIEEEE